MAERPEVRCRLQGGGPPQSTASGETSKFVLLLSTGGQGRTIPLPLLDGDNIVEVDSSAVGAGSDVSNEDVKPQVRLIFE